MKKRKFAMFAIAAVSVAALGFTFAACGGGDGGSGGGSSGVSDAEWTSSLTFDADNMTSVTLGSYSGCTYDWTQASAYDGTWSEIASVLRFDLTNKNIYLVGTSKALDSTTSKVTTEVTVSYLIYYKNAYWNWVDGGSCSPVLSTNTTSASSETTYNRNVSSISAQCDLFNMYAGLKAMFTYDSTSDTYVMSANGNSTAIEFLTNGVGMQTIMTSAENHYTKTTITDVNSTTFTVPEQAYTDIDAYLASQTQS